VDQANALQFGIWRGLDPAWPVSGTNSIRSVTGWSWDYINDTLKPILEPWLEAFEDSGWTDVGNVRVMNLRKFVESSHGTIELADGRLIKLKEHSQDQLFLLPPETGNVVPELPTFFTSAGLIAAAVVCGLISYARKKQKTAAA
jgi:hypothetical protein